MIDIDTASIPDCWRQAYHALASLGILYQEDPSSPFTQVQENTGWEIKSAPDLNTTAPPTADELHILREELDPGGIYI